MATTLATEKQAEAIKQQMAEIRTELPYNVDDARSRVRQLTDWKYHLSRHPLPILASTVVAGYLLVPSQRTPERIVAGRDLAGVASETLQPATRGWLGSILGTVATLAVRQASAVAVSQVIQLLSKRAPS